MDFPCPIGTRVQAGMAGTVTVAGWSTTGFGWHVRVKYDDGNTAIHGHMSRLSVKVGQRVAKRQLLGYSGSTGNSTGPHLHWEVRKSSYVPSSSWNFTYVIEPYYKPYVTPSDPKPPTNTTPYFDRTKLKAGMTNDTVKRFQVWLWSKQPSAYKGWFNENIYNMTYKGATGFYGPATKRLVADTYKRLNSQYPNGNWDYGVVNGVWPTEPGKAFLTHFGARTN